MVYHRMHTARCLTNICVLDMIVEELAKSSLEKENISDVSTKKHDVGREVFWYGTK